MTYPTITVEWSQALVSNNNAREDWRARSTRMKKQRTKAKTILGFNRVKQVLGETPPGHRIVVRLSRLSKLPLDPGDNHNSSFKAVRDEISEHLGINDRYDDLLHFVYEPHVKSKISMVRASFTFEPHTPIQRAIISQEKDLATTPKQWAQRGMLSSGIVRNR
jgi:hypothetical protein